LPLLRDGANVCSVSVSPPSRGPRRRRKGSRSASFASADEPGRLGPALVCGLRGGFGLDEEAEEWCEVEDETRCECSAREADAGSGGALVPSSSARREERRGDFDFDRTPSEYASVYFESASWRSASFVDTTRSSLSSSSSESVPDEDATTILTRTKNFTETRSDSMDSPIAHRLYDLAAGH